MNDDKGHRILIADIQMLLKEASEYQFHDFKNKLYSMPKVALNNFLLKMAENTRNGKYDNESVG